ncbi:DMT family transporter [Modicisalibacter luteus]|uniref:DMT family transporter n=1 Tax=Modicisalibacter luteus TaxID=453962 RepID=A0ABV7M646_9GAMM|nr:DMT family transporter [Halomonas lutea]GHA86157.1 transporter [Halomonas lutea]
MACTAFPSKTASRSNWQALGCLLLVGTLLALSFVVAKLADAAGAPRLTFLVVAMLGAGCLLLGAARCQRQPTPLTRRTLEYAAISGMLFALPNAMGFLAVRHVGAGFVSLSFAFPILVTWFLAVMLKLEPLRLARLSGVLLGLAGGVLVGLDKASGTQSSWGWAAIVLAMPVIIATGNLYRTLRWPTDAAPVFLAALMMFGAAASLLPFVLFFEAEQAAGLLSSAAVIRLLAMETGVFTVLYLFYFMLQKLAGPVYLSQIGTVAALIGTIIAVLGLGESLPSHLGWAATLIVVGTALFHRGGQGAAT